MTPIIVPRAFIDQAVKDMIQDLLNMWDNYYSVKMQILAETGSTDPNIHNNTVSPNRYEKNKDQIARKIKKFFSGKLSVKTFESRVRRHVKKLNKLRVRYARELGNFAVQCHAEL